MTPVAIDHLVILAPDLASGSSYVEAMLGVRPAPGGKHVAMGTHNAVLSLGPGRYLEVMAIDPEAAAPARPRWFDLDEPRMRATLAEGPKLAHFVARTTDIAGVRERVAYSFGAIRDMARGDLHWKITIPDDGRLPGSGLVPTLIEWPPGVHPTDRLPDAGLRLAALAGEHPEPAPIRKALAALGLGDEIKVTYGRHPRLAAMLRTPRGVVTL